MSDGAITANQYDAMAAAYTTDNDDNVYNALYERPAMLRLAGHVSGLRVLDAGCGAGQLTLELCRRGAAVVGIDSSAQMIEIATERLGNVATFEHGDLREPLAAEAGSFDLVVASLVMHYLADWVPVLREFGRVLTPQGKVVLSTHHPTMDWIRLNPDDYFVKRQITDTWTKGGMPFDVTFWRRSLAQMSAEIAEAGFVIERINEPMPHDSLPDRDPKTDAYLRTNPHFLFLTLRKQ